MEKIIGLKDLRQNVDKYVAEIEKGSSFTVVRRSRPLFKISSVDSEDEGVWESVVDFTKIRPGGVPAEEILKELRKLESGKNR